MRARNGTAPTVENAQFLAMVRRMIRAAGRRAAGDVDQLGAMRELAAEVDRATRAAVDACRAEGYSWEDIAQRLGVTKPTAWERYGPGKAGTSKSRKDIPNGQMTIDEAC